MVVLELARVSAELAVFWIINYLGILSIKLCGSEEQKQNWIPRLASADIVGMLGFSSCRFSSPKAVGSGVLPTASFGLTEPEGGSDVSGMRTVAKKVPGGWVLNGSKRWIGNATFAGNVQMI